MNLRPLRNGVIVQREDEKTLTDGGIAIPTQAADKPLRGKVLAVGPGRYLETGDLIATQVEVGDTVLFGERAGQEVEVDNVKYIVMTDAEILAIDADG